MQLPAYLQSSTAPKLADQTVSHLGVGSPPYISIMGNRFTLIDASGAEEAVATYDPQRGPYLDCAIVDAGEHMSKIFYDKPFDPNAGQYEPPPCFSDNGIGPSRNASKPQARTCAECPNNVWGSKTSAVSGKGVKACSDFQKVAVMIPGDDTVFLLRVPPASLGHLRAYLQKFVGQQADVKDVVTRLTFELGQIGMLKFDAVSFIDEGAYRQREQLYAARKTDLLVGRGDLPRPEGLPAPAAAQQIAAPPQTPPAQPAPQLFDTGSTAQPGFGAMNVAPSPQPEQPAQQPAQGGKRPRRQRNTSAQQPPAQAAPAAAQEAPAPQAGQAGVATSAPSNFGMQQPQAAPDEIMQQMDAIFGPAQ